MAYMLASVTSPAEAAIAADSGADIIDLKDPRNGALGALDLDVVAEVVRAVNARVPSSATLGDDLTDPDAVAVAARRLTARGVAYVKVGLFERDRPEPFIESLGELCAEGISIIVVQLADRAAPGHIDALARAGCAGTMLDTAGKDGRGLRDHLDDATLGRFVAATRSAGLMCGLAGSLCIADIAPLLSLGPDVLGFRGALCRGSDRTAAIDANACAQVRAAFDAAPGRRVMAG